MSDLFNVYELVNIGESTFVTLDGFSLGQNETYYVWVIGKDNIHCLHSICFKQFTFQVLSCRIY